jgi:hypothetical protein
MPFVSVRVAALEPSEGLAAVSCPIEAAVSLALATGTWSLGAARPALSVAAACVELPDGRGTTVMAHAVLEVAAAGEPEAEYEADSERLCAACEGGAGSLLITTARALLDAIDRAAAQLELTRATDDEVAAMVAKGASAGAEVLLGAIDQAGDRRVRAAVPALVRLLESTDETVVLRAAGALGRLGDPAAVRPLGRLALSRAPEVPHVALRAIGDIGGPEARRTLDLVGNQTTDAVISREVRDLLRELDEGSGE